MLQEYIRRRNAIDIVQKLQYLLTTLLGLLMFTLLIGFVNGNGLDPQLISLTFSLTGIIFGVSVYERRLQTKKVIKREIQFPLFRYYIPGPKSNRLKN